jgi:trehalose 6-phosphate phosphatase
MRLFLFLDYDGTLVPIAARPAQAVPPPELLQLLQKLVGQDDLRVAVVSGRDLQDLESLLPVPGLYLAACHGAVIKTPGATPYTLIRGADRQQLEHLARAAQNLIAGRRGFLVEPKAFSLAFHYRLADPTETAPVLREFLAMRQHHCPAPDWETIPGHKVLEVRPAGVNKGAAVLHLLNHWPGAFPVYIGDDRTDEDAFRALAGRGRTILVADHPRPTAAQECLPRAAVLALLHRLAAGGAFPAAEEFPRSGG